MKKVTLALTVLLSLGLAACSNTKEDDNSYKGTILFSEYEGSNLKLTIQKDNCDASKRAEELERIVITHTYDSNFPVGACVRISETEDGIALKNISRTTSRDFLSRTPSYQ